MTTTTLHATSGAVITLDVARWRSSPDETEVALLATVADPVLDIGCGPGRLAAHLAATGRVALGIDPSPFAVTEARQRGAHALQRSVFDPLPGEGRWATALLLDGNVGIGGDPRALLARVSQLLRPSGEAVVEVDAPGTPTETLTVRLHPRSHPASRPFPWARVGADGIASIAAMVGLTLLDLETGAGRWLARLVRP